MKFCAECGTELSETTAFCSNCGKAVDSNEEVAPTKAASPKPTQQKPDIGAFFKKNKMLVSITLSVAVVFVVGYLLLSYFNSPERYVDGVIESIDEDDYATLSSEMYFAETEEEISESDVEIYVNYLKENQNRLDQVKMDLEDQVAMIDRNDPALENSSSIGEAFNWAGISSEMYLVRDEGFMTDSYVIYVQPSYLTVEASLDGLTLIDASDEDLHTYSERESSFEVGPLVRGEHTFVFTYESEFMELEEEQQIYVGSQAEYFQPNFDVDYLVFESDLDHDFEETLMINGKEVENLVFNEEIGPFLLDEATTYEYQVDFPWGSMTTGEQTIDSQRIQIGFQLNEELADQLAGAMQSHYDVVLDSFSERDFSLLDDMDSNLQGHYENDLNSMHRTFDRSDDWQAGLHYKDFQIQNEISLIDQNEQGEWFVRVPVAEEKLVINTYQEINDSDLENYRKNNRFYQLNYRDDAWVLANHISTFGHSFSEDKESFDFTYDGDVRLLEREDTETEDDAEAAITSQVEGYVGKLVEAINAGDYSIVSSYIASGSSLESDQQSLVDRLSEAGMTQEVESVTVQSVESEDDVWKVGVEEVITIQEENESSETNTYEWTYTVVEEDGSYLLSNIED